MITLDDIRVCRWWALRLARTALSTRSSLWRRRTLRRLLVRLLLSGKVIHNPTLLSRKLSITRLTAHGSVVRLLALPPRRLLVCDDIVCRGALAIRYLLVLIVRLGVL